MGQKVNPYGFRLGFNKTWHSRWFAGVSEIDIERTANKMRINIYTSRPGIIIGRKGAEVDKLRDELQKLVNGEVYINIQEIQRPELDAQLVAENIATQLERRIAFRRAMKKAACRCTRSRRTSTTASPRPPRPTGRSASRCGCTRVRWPRPAAAAARS